MKKFFLFLLILSFSPLFAEIKFSLRPLVSFGVGEHNEYVYYKYEENDGKSALAKLSELNWEQNGLIFLGLDADFTRKNMFWNVGVKFAIPVISGIMADSDWLNVDKLPTVSLDKAEVKTNYTESECKTNGVFELDGKFCYRLGENENLAFCPFAELSYSYNSLTAWGMDGKYSRTRDSEGCLLPWDSETSVKKYAPYDEAIMKLERHWLVLWLGADTQISIKKINISFALSVCPAAICLSKDEHILRSLVFLDLIYGFFSAAKMESSVGISVTKNSSLNFFVDMQASLLMKGVSFIGTSNSNDYGIDTEDVPGADFKSFEAGISYCWKF